MNFNIPNTANRDMSFESKDRIDMEHKIKSEILFKDFKKELKKIILEKLSEEIDKIDVEEDDNKVDDYNE